MPLRVLLVEDNIVNQRVAIGVLEQAGHHVTPAGNGRIALGLLKQSRFDLVLMDMQMPEMGGVEAIANIRQGERTAEARIPIISVTAQALQGDRQRCLDAGADGYVAKPITPAVLHGEIEGVLARVAAKCLPPPLARAAEGLLERLGGNHELLLEIIDLFLEDCPKQLEEIREALANNDTQSAYRAAHTLKGSAGNFDAHEVMAIVQRLEARARDGDVAAATRVFEMLECDVRSLLDALAGAKDSLLTSHGGAR
jgi:two-component system, sensor histidine kinase and response regulator